MFRGFACPQEELEAGCIATITIQIATEVTSLFVTRFAAELRANSCGLTELLGGWRAAPTDFELTWDPAFGNVYVALVRRQATHGIVMRAAALGLRLSAYGLEGRWRAAWDGEAIRLRWSRWLLPPTREIEVESDAATAVIRLRNGEEAQIIKFLRNPGRLLEGDAESLPQFGLDGPLITLSPPHSWQTDAFGAVREWAIEDPASAEATLCQEALLLLQRHAPIYLPWVTRLLRQVIPLRPDEGRMRSGGVPNQYGVIYASLYANPMALAELFVHEVTHQYFYLAEQCGAVEDGSDATLYYSPFVGRERPLSRILVAYHAFANVLMLYRLCRAGGVEDAGYCTQNEPKLAAQVASIEPVLRESVALTPIGRALYQPLMERLQGTPPCLEKSAR